MRFRDAISVAEILEACRPFLPADSPLPIDLPSAVGGMDSPEYAASDSLSFVTSKIPSGLRGELKAALVFAEAGVSGLSTPTVRVASVRAVMAALLEAFRERFREPAPFSAGAGNQVHPTAVMEGCLEGRVSVGAGAYVGRGAFIGSGSRIEANAVILDRCVVGRNCVVQSGAAIGCAGFGFFEKGSGFTAMPHLAGVEIGDDCWIGAHAVIAAGVLNPTSLGRACKLDSHVQIAHNVRLGEGCLLASQSGIAGSTRVGDGFRMGGAASVDGHLRIGRGVSVAACSGVTKDLPDGAVVAGFPARPIREWRREQVLLRRSAREG